MIDLKQVLYDSPPNFKHLIYISYIKNLQHYHYLKVCQQLPRYVSSQRSDLETVLSTKPPGQPPQVLQGTFDAAGTNLPTGDLDKPNPVTGWMDVAPVVSLGGIRIWSFFWWILEGVFKC